MVRTTNTTSAIQSTCDHEIYARLTSYPRETKLGMSTGHRYLSIPDYIRYGFSWCTQSYFCPDGRSQFFSCELQQIVVLPDIGIKLEFSEL